MFGKDANNRSVRHDVVMLHMRVIVPPDQTEEIGALLADHPGATNVVVLPGSAREPQGDLLLCDLARESVDEIIEELKERGIPDRGSIAFEPIELSISKCAKAAEEEAPGHGDDAVIWQEIEQRTDDEIQLTWSFLAFLALATQLAGIAAIIDSPVLIVGAMVLGPEFGAVAAISYGLLVGDWQRIGRAVRTLVIGLVVAIAITWMCAWVSHEIGVLNVDRLPDARPLTGFVYNPDRWSFIVALLAGAAGVLSMTSGKSSALVGVFISVTTVPAAGNIAVGYALGHWNEVNGSFQQLGINILGMIIAGWLTLLVQKIAWRLVLRRRSGNPAR
ncbi:MAG: DUF389 domain-containing protein [Streptosporangiaceae bacterium]